MPNKLSVVLIAALALVFLNFSKPADIYMTKSGTVSFVSKAQLEEIEAENNLVDAVVNRADKTVAFKVPIVGFHGFNSALQEEHFNENYLESEQFPEATFEGKIIEDVNLMNNGTYKVRVKGMLEIHGIELEQVIAGVIAVKDEIIQVTSSFEVPLSDYGIKTPRIVNQKIAQVVDVKVAATLKPKPTW